MPVLQRIIEHLQNLVLISDVTMLLLGISITILSLAFACGIFIKKDKYESLIVKVGIFVRVLMLIGFTIEFSHQKAIYHGSFIVYGKDDAVEQFSNYLFYGYIFVIGLYDIFAMGINKFRGYFHTFDLAMMSMPILFALTDIILHFGFDMDSLISFCILASQIILPYLFFKLYWKQNIKWYVIFLGYTVLLLIIYKVIGMKPVLTYTLLSYFLLGLYELSRYVFEIVRKVARPQVWRSLKYISIIIPVLLIYSSLVALNISPLQINKTYIVDSFYREETAFTSLEEAENLARKAVGDTTGSIKLQEGTSENFNNIYMLSIGNYSVRIDGATGKLQEVRNENQKPVEPKGKLSEEDIRAKTINWLKTVGFSFDEKRHSFKIEKQADEYIILMFSRFSDGTLVESPTSTIDWYVDGKLNYASIGMFSAVDDYKDIKINEAGINSSIKDWYAKLGETAPAYAIERFNYWYGQFEPSLNIICRNNDRIGMNSYNGEITFFDRGESKNQNFSKENYEKLKTKAEKLAEILCSSWSEHKYMLKEIPELGYKQYMFSDERDGVSNYIGITLDSQGSLNFYSAARDRDIRQHKDSEFKISSSDALKIVSKEYKTFGTYTKRVKLEEEIKDNGDVNYKWMVMVIPFKNVEHQIYYVDTDTGKITPLLNYRK